VKSELDYDRESELLLYQSMCSNSFYGFVQWAFGVENYIRTHPANNWLQARVHRPLCDWFEWHVREWLRSRHIRPVPKKLMVVWPRGFGKTTIITKAGQLWLHVLDPDLSTITDSVTAEKSWDFLKALKDIMAGDDPNSWFPYLYGNWKDPKRAWKAGFLNHAYRRSLAAEAASMVCSSVEKGITGKHPDALFIDDPIVQEKLVEGLAWIEKVNRHTDAMIPALRSDGLLVATATRYHDTDWLGKYMREEGVRSVSGMKPPYLDFEVSDKGAWELYFLQARDQLGTPVLPEVSSQEFLDAYERKNPMDFQAQMMNEPGEGEHMPIHRKDIEGMWVSRKDVPGNLRISVHCDTAWKSRKSVGKGDFSVIQVWGHAQDGSGAVYYLFGKRSNRWTPEEFGNNLVQVLQKLKAETKRAFTITDEMAVGGKADVFEGLVWNWCAQAGMVAPPVLLLSRAGTRKEIRIREAAGYWANQKVKLVRDADGVHELVAEMLRIGVSAHDDMADAAADVFHPDVYTPERVFGHGDESPISMKPTDDVLQGSFTDEAVRRAYDDHVRKQSEGSLGRILSYDEL